MVVQKYRDDEKRITELIERWAAAIRAQDLPGVLADHADDIVMFDVPQDAVRGIRAYQEVWPPFFRWIAAGAVFDVAGMEVTAGTNVAFAHLLVRCGTPDDLAHRPDHRLRNPTMRPQSRRSGRFINGGSPPRRRGTSTG